MVSGGISVGVQGDEAGGGAEQGSDVDDGRTGRWRRYFARFTLPGAWGALIFACLSFTPSLLPRGGFLQGLLCGITAAIGYGVGVWIASMWRAFADRGQRQPRQHSWLVFWVVAVVALVVMFASGQYWQYRIRGLMGVTDYNLVLVALSPVVAVVAFAALLALGRAIRSAYRWLARQLQRWIGARAAAVVGWIAVVGFVYVVVSGVLLSGLVDLANRSFSVRDATTAEGVEQPTGDLRSGSPDSLIAWDNLGREGQKFVAGGLTAQEITEVTGEPAMDPIRAYAGLTAAEDSQERAALAVDDLERAGGFDREYLLLMTTTGSGWVDPAAVDSFELMTGGDSATVAMQYSYLPSWISYLVDQSKARAAGRDLFDAVYERWSQLPPDDRPQLFVAGESLGSFGGEAAFSGEYDLRNRTSGTLFAGPPAFNSLFGEFRDERDAGSREVEPVYKDGRTVRFTNDASQAIGPADQPWDGTRVLYLMHPSDPIVWWSPDLIFNEPDWIREAPGRDVLEQSVWIPIVTFWQVSADLPFSTGVPGGHGHHYTTEYVDGWNSVLRPEGLTNDDLARIKAAVAGE